MRPIDLAPVVVAALLCAAPDEARAQPAVVEAVQSPAWLDRGGRSVPLTPGIALEARDRLVTGGNARVRLKLAEGSAVKLGENAQFVIERAEDRGIFRGALAVIAGAFRFTTAPGSTRARDLAIKVKNATVGIRGTDLWGKSTDARDWVVLLEGRISVAPEGGAPVVLQKPNEMFVQDRGATPRVQDAEPADVARWSEETEIARDGAGGEAAPRGWKVVAAMLPSRDAARSMVRDLRGAGFPAETREVERYHLVEVPRLGSEGQAREVMANLRARPGVTMPKVVPMH